MTKITQFAKNAKIAQLVEHDLAKVGVAGSSPVFRSENIEKMIEDILFGDIAERDKMRK